MTPDLTDDGNGLFGVAGLLLGPKTFLPFSIVEAVLGHGYALLLLLTAYSVYTRPVRAQAWVSQWRYQATVFVAAVWISEFGWVQLAWVVNPVADTAICVWTPGMLLVWILVQLSTTCMLLSTWVMRWQHVPQSSVATAIFTCILVRAQATGITALVTAISGTGACGMMVIPLCTMAIGTAVALSALCTIMPFRISRTPIHDPPAEFDTMILPLTLEEEMHRVCANARNRLARSEFIVANNGRGGSTDNDIEALRSELIVAHDSSSPISSGTPSFTALLPPF